CARRSAARPVSAFGGWTRRAPQGRAERRVALPPSLLNRRSKSGRPPFHRRRLGDDLIKVIAIYAGAVAELVGIEGGVVSGVINLESSGVEASDWRPRHDEQ